MKYPVPIIDLFAGPGGLGEGFCSVVNEKKERVFKIVLSIERDEFAHQTLTLRSFLRQFPIKKLPKEYYQFLQGKIESLDKLFELYPVQAKAAKHEAWKFSLGDKNDHSTIDQRIREALGNTNDFVLIGGPPCQAYSLVGRARRQEKEGLNKEDERVFLYREYYRILAVHQPAVFIMENVKGLLSSKLENVSVFNQILDDLKKPVEAYRKLHGKNKIPESKHGYRIYSLVKRPQANDLFENEYKPSDFIIRAEEYGIPQTRHRVILLGIRNDLKFEPGVLQPTKRAITVEDVLSGIPSVRSSLSKEKDGKDEWKKAINELLLSELDKQIDKAVYEEMKRSIARLKLPEIDKGSNFVMMNDALTINYKPEWYLDRKIKGILNHESRSHIKTDLWRYIFVSCFGRVKGRSPKLSEFPPMLVPNHKNARSGDFANRFKSQLLTEPSKTITSHISKDGHYFIHPDPTQCRSLTVREAARIQTFPDNYFFCGPRTEQFHQVGNAVPPMLAYQIACMIRTLFSY